MKLKQKIWMWNYFVVVVDKDLSKQKTEPVSSTQTQFSELLIFTRTKKKNLEKISQVEAKNQTGKELTGAKFSPQFFFLSLPHSPPFNSERGEKN